MERNEIAAICISGDLSLEQYLVIKKNKIDFKGILQPRIPFISEKIQKKIFSEKEKVEKILGNNSRFIFYEDKEYPQLLKEINNPPLVLFYHGDISLLKYEVKIAIVGSRNASDYGLNYTEKFAKELSEYNIVIISGMAAGIDGRAHKGALKEKGKTIAVLGSGINVPYPSCNRNLYNEICNSGLVISEYLPDTPPYKQNFPRRNRIVVGLSKGLLVTQAAFKSGSMISAKLASEFNRDVFALPGKGVCHILGNGPGNCSHGADVKGLCGLKHGRDKGRCVGITGKGSQGCQKGGVQVHISLDLTSQSMHVIKNRFPKILLTDDMQVGFFHNHLKADFVGVG